MIDVVDSRRFELSIFFVVFFDSRHRRFFGDFFSFVVTFKFWKNTYKFISVTIKITVSM